MSSALRTVRGAQFATAGFILVDKPSGPTSAAVVGGLKRALRESGVIDKSVKIGHGGTLDPMATGLLVILLGRGTRLADLALHANKTYSGTIQLGYSTDTDDVTGAQVGERLVVPRLTQTDLDEVAKKFTGKIKQRPPSYSALKVDGKRAYDLARAGNEVILTEREIDVSRIELKLVATDQIGFVVESSGGTYIRSLARDIGALIGCGGTLAALRRERSGGFFVENAALSIDPVSGQAILEKIVIQAWWELLSTTHRVEVDETISVALAGGDQRALRRMEALHLGGKLGELMIYQAHSVPHGVVRQTKSGLELILHVGGSL